MNRSAPKALDSAALWEAIKPASIDESLSAINSDKVVEINPPHVNQPETKPHLTHLQITDIASDAATASKSEHIVRTDSQENGFANIENAKPLSLLSFPNLPRKIDNQKPCTYANIRYLLMAYGIIIRYNVISKKVYITIPGVNGTPDNADNVAITHIYSLANLNDMATGQIMNLIGVIADKNQFNPVAEWIVSKPWDGVDRLNAFYATLVERAGFPETLKNQLMYRWLLSAVAAVLKPSGFKARGVLTLQGPQSIGKTSWISALVPDAILREGVLKLDHHLDAGNKDSIITAVCHWIVEIGELDSSFKKDIARLKGFLTADRDKVRRPYGRTDSEYPRRTVFCATVNEHDFLVDSTGNSRWWTIPVTSINYQHGIDMQQLFAQLTIDFNNDAQWWLTREEEQLLELHNKEHRNVSAIRERILEALDLDHVNDSGLPALTPTQLLQKLDIKHPTNTQSKECASVLREFVGESKKIQGQYKWRIPFKKDGWAPLLTPKVTTDDDF
ncbi:MAG: virulence-associated E family protein [Betaproteobacteria bacterium]